MLKSVKNVNISHNCTTFYGEKNKKKLESIHEALDRAVHDIHRYHIPSDFKRSLCGPSTQWKLFYRQKDAFDFLYSNSKDLAIFAFESDTFYSNIGQRLYLVASYPVFWHYYSQLGSEVRHHYEVIREDAVCKLYFDLEFKKSLNPRRKEAYVIKNFIKFVRRCLLVDLEVDCDEDDVIDLCSSTEVKFSHHLIFLTPDVAFKSNIHAGKFVNNCMQRLVASEERRCPGFAEGTADDDFSSLLAVNSNGETTPICDLGVYSRNRNFRLYLSSKRKKGNPLVLSSNTPYATRDRSDDEGVFHDSLIGNVRYSSKMRIVTFDIENSLSETTSPADTERHPPSMGSPACTGYRSSPFGSIDAFITELVSPVYGGYIRAWQYFAGNTRIVYEIARYRRCGNVGRQHKSNNVMFVVDLKAGVYYQKCHDPECQRDNYRSPYFKLPAHLSPPDDKNWENDIDDETLLNCSNEGSRSPPSSASKVGEDFDQNEALDRDLNMAVEEAEFVDGLAAEDEILAMNVV